MEMPTALYNEPHKQGQVPTCRSENGQSPSSVSAHHFSSPSLLSAKIGFGRESRGLAGSPEQMEERLSLLALTLIPKVGPKIGRALLNTFGSASKVFSASPSALKKVPWVTPGVVHEILSKQVICKAEQELRFADRHGIQIVPYNSEKYPKKLREVEDSPLLLYANGQLPREDQPNIAIVGTRTPSSYGRKMAREFADHFAERGVGVISGLAFGVDYEAHLACLEKKSYTCAVLGHGFGQIYPREHASFARDILREGGALVTEFCSQTQPEAYNFPARNRIISGLCDAVVVIEAAEKGGALITARVAFDQNREVFAVPGSLGSQSSVGSNRLIRDQIARLACGPEDVLEGIQHLLRIEPQTKKAQSSSHLASLSRPEQSLLESIGESELDIDELVYQQGGDEALLRSLLLGMELRGLVRFGAGNKVALVG